MTDTNKVLAAIYFIYFIIVTTIYILAYLRLRRAKKEFMVEIEKRTIENYARMEKMYRNGINELDRFYKEKIKELTK